MSEEWFVIAKSLEEAFELAITNNGYMSNKTEAEARERITLLSSIDPRFAKPAAVYRVTLSVEPLAA